MFNSNHSTFLHHIFYDIVSTGLEYSPFRSCGVRGGISIRESLKGLCCGFMERTIHIWCIRGVTPANAAVRIVADVVVRAGRR